MAHAHFSRFGFSTRRILTDNGSCYRDGRFRMLLKLIEHQTPLHQALHSPNQGRQNA